MEGKDDKLLFTHGPDDRDEDDNVRFVIWNKGTLLTMYCLISFSLFYKYFRFSTFCSL